MFNKDNRELHTRAERNIQLDKELEEELAARNAPKNTETNTDSEDQNLNKEEKTWKKRHGDLKSFHDKTLNDLKNKIFTLEGQLKSATEKQIKFPKTEEEVSEWVQKYPDVAAIVETIAMKKVADVRKEVEDAKTANAQRAYENEFERCTNKIAAAHDDFYELQENEDFMEWLQKQPKYIRTVFNSDSPLPYEDLEDAADTAILAIRMYKSEKTPAQPKKDNSNRDAARSVTKNSPSAPKDRDENMIYESDIQAMNIREYEKHEDEIMKAMREGRVVYDLSGAAR